MPVAFDFGNFAGIAGDDNGLRLPGENLLAADLGPGCFTGSENILAAAQRQDLILNRSLAAGKRGLLPNWRKTRFFARWA